MKKEASMIHIRTLDLAQTTCRRVKALELIEKMSSRTKRKTYLKREGLIKAEYFRGERRTYLKSPPLFHHT